MREIEIKLRVENLTALEKSLTFRGCVLAEPIHQHDTVYSHDGDMSAREGMREGYQLHKKKAAQ
jgi:adenylate cyclase class IV